MMTANSVNINSICDYTWNGIQKYIEIRFSVSYFILYLLYYKWLYVFLAQIYLQLQINANLLTCLKGWIHLHQLKF